ncbi:hypothetical protein BXY82_2815 [Gelidibacter sediminis]|uniref:Uncharacterized protein n=1 Tax=Gelidibacter sediminis TaxID=1608710 RepID=A0A4R7PLR8_9FLAO|nr:hypothetical protein BXY82_2815 [Gelidibacter sediminis]
MIRINIVKDTQNLSFVEVLLKNYLSRIVFYEDALVNSGQSNRISLVYKGFSNKLQ